MGLCGELVWNGRKGKTRVHIIIEATIILNVDTSRIIGLCAYFVLRFVLYLLGAGVASGNRMN